MMDNGIFYYDVFGLEEKIYAALNSSYGYDQKFQHFHGKYELTLVLSEGETRVNCGGHSYLFNGPHIRLHKPYSFHIAYADKTQLYERYVFYFSEKSVDFACGLVDVKRLFSEDYAIVPLGGEALECARHLSAVVLQEKIDRAMQRMALAGLLALAAHYRGTSTDAYRESSCDYLGEVLSYIDEHYADRLTAGEIARQFYVSEQKLNADFKEYMRETLHHYIVSVKVSKAAGMIALGKSPLDAAVSCGFSDESHFSKTFKSRIGLTPYQFNRILIKQIDYNTDDK